MSTLFRDAVLVELDPPTVRQSDLRVAKGRIESLGTNLAPQPGDEIVDCGGAVLMPGLVCGHTHLYSALAAGMPAPPRQPQNFHEILELIWWRLDRAHNLESVGTSGQIGALTALRCGTTTLIDHHASPNCIDGSLSALEEGIAAVGCRGVLCYEVTDRNRDSEGAEGLVENERYIRACQSRNDGRFAALVGAHASFTLSEQSLATCAEMAGELGVGVHIHVAEDPVDERLTREKFGVGLIDRFERVGLLEVPGSILGHGTHLSPNDIARLAEFKEHLHLAHNPSSNMNNGVGYTKVANVTLPVVLGTDGIGADMWRESRIAEFKSHDAHAPLPFGGSLRMLAESARFASQALGISLGKLEDGAAADLVLTNYRPATPLDANNLAGHFLFALGPELVESVMIDGRWCLRNGKVVSCDETALRAHAVETSRALWQRID
jgi:putative selenium metabolism protein SsnA